MTDMRHCDGPDCDKRVPLEDDGISRSLADPGPDSYIKLKGRFRKEMHFHSDECLNKWARSSARATV